MKTKKDALVQLRLVEAKLAKVSISDFLTDIEEILANLEELQDAIDGVSYIDQSDYIGMIIRDTERLHKGV